MATRPAPAAAVPIGRELPRLRRSSLRDQVADVLEERILGGTFPPGTRMPTEFELAGGFGVSRTVIRDALRLLEARGLVDIRRGIGTMVKATSADAYANAVAMILLRSELTIGDVFEARAALEGQLAFVAAVNHTAEHRDLMFSAFERFDEAVHGRDEVAIVRAHVGFHTELLRATNLPALETLLRPIQGLMLATSLTGRDTAPTDPKAWSVGVHRALLEAIAGRDREAVAAANEGHWAPPIRGDSYKDIRRMRVGDVFPTPRDLLRDSQLDASQ